jgi:glutamine synthetase
MFKEFIEKYPEVKFFRLQWIDYSGVVHAKVIPKTRCSEVFSGRSKSYLSQNCLIIPISSASDGQPMRPQRWELAPDWSSLKLCGFNNRHAAIMCHLKQLFPEHENPNRTCPRKALESAVHRYGCDTQILLGFEIEFVLLDNNLNLPLDISSGTGYTSLSGLRGKNLEILEEIYEALEKSDIMVYDFHVEIAGQLEIVLPPAEPVKAIDDLMMAQETIHYIAAVHGLRASMAPRTVVNGPENSLHVHLSLNPRPENADNFIAGILQNLSALCAFGMPSIDSYIRIKEYAAGCVVGWGTENRHMPIRKISDNHWEFRFCDASANMYLFLAALLSAGWHGMDNHVPLTWKDCMEVNGVLSSKQMREHNITEMMPTTLKAAVLVAKKNIGLKNWLGQELVDSYLTVKGIEIEKFARESDEQRRKKFLVAF